MSKYNIPNDYEWADEQDPETNTKPVFEMGRHTIQIDDNRDSHGYEHGLDWLFSIEGGEVKGYMLGHWLEGRTQSDPMQSPAWEDVPGYIKGMLRKELNLEPGEEIPTDLPDFYGEQDG